VLILSKPDISTIVAPLPKVHHLLTELCQAVTENQWFQLLTVLDPESFFHSLIVSYSKGAYIKVLFPGQ
jgi:hypothetical protein